MLEAKAKDQKHKRKCSPKKKVFTKIFQAISKKKGLQKNFSSDLHKKTFSKNFSSAPQNFKSEVESRTQGSRPRPRTQKNPRPRTAFPRTDPLKAKDRNARGQGPRTQVQVLSKKKRSSQKFFRRYPKKKVFTKIFQEISRKKRLLKNFSSAPQNFNNSKNSAVLEPRTGQFSRTWGFEARAKDLNFEAKAKDFKMCPRGLNLC